MRAEPITKGVHHMRLRTMRLLGAAAVVSAALLAGCNSSDATPATPSPTTAATPSPTTPKWESKYSEKELEVYREAVQRVAAYETKTQPIWAQGKATKAAKELFQDNLLGWQATFRVLQSSEKQGIKVANRPEVLNTKARSIKFLKDNGAEVQLIRCTDQSDLGGTMEGRPLANAYDKPVVQTVDVYRYSDGRWRFGPFKTMDKKCTP